MPAEPDKLRLPRPGQCVCVRFRSGEKKVADVMRLSESCDAALCKTIKLGLTFWLHPQRIHAKRDPPDAKIDFQGIEVQRLQQALDSDGRLGNLPGGKVKKYPGFVTAPSQYCVRVARNLTTGAHSAEDDGALSLELEAIIDMGSQEVKKTLRELGEGATADRILQRRGESSHQFLAAVKKRQKPPPRLVPGQELKC